MRQGLAGESPTRTAATGPGEFDPPDPAELAARFPQFEILELIGRGGMGAVYKARQLQLDRVVALKILAPERVRDPAFAERFGREARTLARLSHPHIVGVHEFGEADGLFYLVMEYVDGASLREVMQAGRLTPGEALALVPQICAALQFAHDTGVVHRDIKPGNILLDRAGRVKIADFGLAKLLEPDRADGVSLTASGAVMGTPAYMAPEQIERPLDVDHRADIYAVGVVFYEMLTGELPLGRFDPPSCKVRMDVRLDHVVLRALEKEPTRRYQLAREVSADLERLDEVEPAPGPGAASQTKTITITRPPAVTWIAAYSFLMAGFLTVVAGLVPLLTLIGVPRAGMPVPSMLGLPGGSIRAGLLMLVPGVGLCLLLCVWHLIAGLGTLRLRNWSRYNLIILAVLELPVVLFAWLSWVLLLAVPSTIVSVLVLVYLFRPPVARVFELGLGPATLPTAEAESIERVIRGS
jgi:tRNA A-37 threonylcarbamoyl transferase component Bud32